MFKTGLKKNGEVGISNSIKESVLPIKKIHHLLNMVSMVWSEYGQQSSEKCSFDKEVGNLLSS